MLLVCLVELAEMVLLVPDKLVRLVAPGKMEHQARLDLLVLLEEPLLSPVFQVLLVPPVKTGTAELPEKTEFLVVLDVMVAPDSQVELDSQDPKVMLEPQDSLAKTEAQDSQDPLDRLDQLDVQEHLAL